jgi:hypothetical protein
LRVSGGVDQSGTAPAVLVTKLHPPVVPGQVVHRERLFSRLHAGRGRRLTLVACPAGFGKSTLLAAWREHEATDRPVAWVTLDEGDDDAVVLWSHAIEALCRVCPALREHELGTAALAAPLREVLLPRLANALAEQGDVMLLHVGAVRFGVTGPLHYTLTARDAVTLCDVARPRVVVPVHYEGWSHFSQGRHEVEEAFATGEHDLRWLPIGEAVEIS